MQILAGRANVILPNRGMNNIAYDLFADLPHVDKKIQKI